MSVSSVQAPGKLELVLPEGLEPPEEIPAEIFDAALAEFLECRRLDMRALAGELGIGRATLYRKAGNRDRLLGEVIWWLTRHALARAIDAAPTKRGAARLSAIIETFMRDVHGRPALRRFLEQEPEAALRILTSKQAPVQQGIADALARLIADEQELGNLKPLLDAETLAYVIVRIGEGFMYADVIADNEPEVDRALKVVDQLLRNGS